MLRFLALFSLWMAFWPAAGAQGQPLPPASLSGRITDSNNRPLEGVEARLIDTSSGRTLIASTDIAGEFRFPNLRSGRYALSVFKDGYAARRLPEREFLPDSPVEAVIVLEELPPPLARPRAGIETIALEYGLAREQIDASPVLLGSQGRTAVDKLQQLAPGLTPVDPIEIDPITGLGAAVSANGSRRSAINYQFDGAANNAQNRLTGAQAATFAPAPEAIETFRAVTHTYSAAEGRNAGAVIRAISRGGGSNWHGQLRGFVRPHNKDFLSYDGSEDSLGGWAGGGQIGGPLWKKQKLFVFFDVEGWRTQQQHIATADTLSLAERSGDLSALDSLPLDPATMTPFPNGVIPTNRLDPLMQKYLDAFVPAPNIGPSLFRGRQDLDSDGQTLVGRLDWRPGSWSLNASHLLYRADTALPLTAVSDSPSPLAVSERLQLANNAQLSVNFAPAESFQQTTRLAGQRLSTSTWQGRPNFRNITANEFGFDYASFGADPGTIPDVTLYDDDGFERLHIAPFLFSEASAQTNWQLSHDAEWRVGKAVLRGGALYQQGSWPFRNTENFAGSFSFPRPPDFPIRSAPNGLRDLLLALPGQYRLQTPRDLNLRWREFAFYGETELRPASSVLITLGLRYESQPPGVDTQDRIAAFRFQAQSERFPNALPNLIFPGDQDGEMGVLPRSTVDNPSNNWGPRLGFAYSPTADRGWARWLLGDAGRSVIRASYGAFYDFGAFAGSSAAALFQATYPPFSADDRFLDLARSPNAFSQPLGVTGAGACGIQCTAVRYPILVFDRDFHNARAEQWNVGVQRLLPGGVFASAVYVGTRSNRLQRQAELNTFVRNPLRPFAFVRSMRLSSRFTDVRQFESSGEARYNGLQLRANRYLRAGLAFDVGYVWSRSDDDGSSVFGNSLATEPWSVSSYDRRHSFTAAWTYAIQPPRTWTDRMPWMDRWSVSGLWRWRSGLPLDIRQTEDPTFTFENIGRPDIVGEFQRLDPSVERTFTLADGRTVTGRFAFDPTVFERVEPTDFDETRPGNVGRNAFRMHGFQQWDLRIARPFNVAEAASAEFAFDLFNVLGSRNWAAPFTNIDSAYFGVVRTEGLRRTFQLDLRLNF